MAKQSESDRREKPKSDLVEKVLFVNRCSKTVKGGRKMSFSALVLVGDCKGQVGVGFAKANELTDAIRKAGINARNNLSSVTIEGTTVPHDVFAKWDGACLMLRAAPVGTGLVAGSMVRAVLELAGFKDVIAKIHGSNNAINQVRATLRALFSMKPKEELLQERLTQQPRECLV